MCQDKQACCHRLLKSQMYKNHDWILKTKSGSEVDTLVSKWKHCKHSF